MQSLQFFWKEHPALLLGLSLFVGASSFLFCDSPWNYIFPLLWSFYLVLLRKKFLIIILISGIFYAWSLYKNGPIIDSPTQIKARFTIDSVQLYISPFQRSHVYKGMIYLNGSAFPCSVYSRSKDRTKANQDYMIEGTLKQRGPYDYLVSPKKWTPLKNSWSSAELRYQLKEFCRKSLRKKLKHRSSLFFGSLITGDVSNRQLRYEFSKVGLQHILAISGFHFGILIAFSSFFLSLFVPRIPKYILLLLIVNSYFLFVGSLPSVQRSWIVAQLYLCAKLFKRQTTGLNLLGCAMAIEISLNPLICGHLGFQLSFLSCGGILLLHPLFEKLLRTWMPKRNNQQLKDLNYFSKRAYILSAFLRQTFSLTLAVQFAILPLLLYHFNQFPLISLFYNLFFPLFVTAIIFFLLLSFSIQFLFPPLGSLLFSVTDWLTNYLLDFSSYPPSQLDYAFLVQNFPAWTIPFYLFLLFSVPICRESIYKLLTNRFFSRKILAFYHGDRSSVG